MLVDQKLENETYFDENQKSAVQELLLLNDSPHAWPQDTELILQTDSSDDSKSDVKVVEKIHIGSVPPKAEVRVQFTINLIKPTVGRKEIQYAICYSAVSTPNQGILSNL